MKRFLLNTLYILLPLLLIAGIMEVLLQHIPNDYKYKKEYLEKNAENIETLILGSSHASAGFNPIYFHSNTFNASHVAQQLNYDYEIFKLYRDRMVRLNTIILPISYFTYFERLEVGINSWRVKNYVIYYGIDSNSTLKNNSEVFSNKFNINVNRLSSYYFFNVSNISCTNLGWGNSYSSTKALDLVKSGEKNAKIYTKDNIYSYENQNIYNQNEIIIHSILEWCVANDIKVLLITLPAFETYIKELNKDQLNITIETTENLSSQYPNCTYLNLLNDTNFVAKDYYDADHLSEIGAKKLSIKMNEILNTQLE